MSEQHEYKRNKKFNRNEYIVTEHQAGKSSSEIAAELSLSPRQVNRFIQRFRAEGEQGLFPRSTRPHHSPNKTSADIEATIIRTRTQLTKIGFDAGPASIGYYLRRHIDPKLVPSDSTIYTILKRHQLITPHPKRRPHKHTRRFAHTQPNGRWQLDITEFPLRGTDTKARIVCVIDDYSRMILGCQATPG